MEENKFFKWTSRINSLLFLALLILSIGCVAFISIESSQWRNKNVVKATGETPGESEVDLRLADIKKVCGRDIQYIELNSTLSKRGFGSGGYGGVTRNVLFFVGEEMKSHWLYESNKYLISKIVELKKSGEDCKDRETVAMYYEVYKDDTNKDGILDNQDLVTAAITLPDGLSYKELDTGINSIIDSYVSSDAATLTLLVQQKEILFMRKFSIQDGHKISESEITKISKAL